MSKSRYEKIKSVRIKAESIKDVDSLIEEYKEKGFVVSNPDCKTGKYFDIINRGNLKVVGFDLFWGRDGFDGVPKPDME